MVACACRRKMLTVTDISCVKDADAQRARGRDSKRRERERGIGIDRETRRQRFWQRGDGNRLTNDTGILRWIICHFRGRHCFWCSSSVWQVIYWSSLLPTRSCCSPEQDCLMALPCLPISRRTTGVAIMAFKEPISAEILGKNEIYYGDLRYSLEALALARIIGTDVAQFGGIWTWLSFFWML